MAINASRNMNAELAQGLRDGSYMQLHPDWGGPIAHSHAERLTWPTYKQAEQHVAGMSSDPITPREPMPNGGIFTIPRHQAVLPDRDWEGSGLDAAADAYNPSITEGSALDAKADAAARRAGGGAASIAAHEAVVAQKKR
jgi:hypothetical protein